MVKKLYYILITGTLCISTVARSQTSNWSEKMAHTVMTIWKDSLVNDDRPARWTYDQGVVLKGIEGVWLKTADKKYFDYIQQSMDHFVEADGNIRTYKQSDYNIDNVLPGRNLLMLYKVTGKDKYYKAATHLRDQLRQHPRTSEGGFWHKKRYPWQMWLDGLYMGEPFYAEYAATFHDDTAFNDIARQFILMEIHARDAKTGLLYHGWDESKEQQWANKTTGLSANFWGRAMGWYGMALIDALPWFPDADPNKQKLIKILQRYASAVQNYQDAGSGLWWDVMDKGGKEGNYLEASASCMFVYALAKGVRLGYLDQKFLPVAQRGYAGIIKEFIETDANGLVNLKGTVSVSGLGGNPYRDGSYEYYLSEKVVVNDPKGVGSFLLASNEMEMLPTLAYGRGKTVLLDDWYNHEVKDDITGYPVANHYKWDERSNGGFSFLGYYFNRYGVDTATLSAPPTAAALKQANFYLIVDPDIPAENKTPHYINASEIKTICKWVKKGGVLILMGNDKGNAEFEHFNELAAEFGIHFNEESLNRVTGREFEMGALTVPDNDPIFTPGIKLYIKELAGLEVKSPAKAVFTKDGHVIMATAQLGKGTVFAVGDPWFYNEYVDGRKLPASFSNARAAQDWIRWLTAQAH